MPENEKDKQAAGAPELGASLEGEDKGAKTASEQTITVKQSFFQKLVKKMSVVNVYLIVFLVLLLVVVIVTLVSVNGAKKNQKAADLVSQTLSPEELAKLKESDTKVGDPKQTLTVESNSVFNGKVLIRDGLDIAGSLTIGSSLNIPGLSVSGTSTFDSIRVGQTVDVGGNATFQGGINISGNINVGQGGTFGGIISAPAITVDTLQLNGDLSLTRHIASGGSVPGISGGGAIGGGGTVSVSGNDIAGTITINTGGGPAAGVLANITFTRTYSKTPKVVISPVGSAAGALNFYVSRSTSGFSVASNNAPAGSTSFAFDYIVIE